MLPDLMGLKEAAQPLREQSVLNILTYIIVFIHSVSHTHEGVPTFTHTAAVCGAPRVKPHLRAAPSGTMMLSVESCWTCHHTSLVFCLMLAPLECLYHSVCL